MTVQEATLIRRHAEHGMLDLALPGTRAIVRQAERTCARADLWGRTREDVGRSVLAVSAIVVSSIAVIAVLMVPLP